jgi:hypothetical protein
MLQRVKRATIVVPDNRRTNTSQVIHLSSASLCHLNYLRDMDYYLHVYISSPLALRNNDLSVLQGDFKC